jgi:hypothetical protein
MKMHRTMLAALAAALLLPPAGCQAPPLDPRIGAATRAAHEGAMQLVAEAEAGRFADPASFEGAAPRYAALDAQLAEARARAEAAPPGAPPPCCRARSKGAAARSSGSPASTAATASGRARGSPAASPSPATSPAAPSIRRPLDRRTGP